MSTENKVPAIRFKGFSEEWEDKRIQDLINEQAIISHLDGNHGELYPRPSEFSDEGIPYIAANDFANGFVNFRRCKYLPITRAKQFKKGIAKDGDVLFAHNATVGPVAKLETDFDFVILSTTATYFRCDNNTLINDYLLQVLSDTKFIKQYSRVMSQSTRNQVPITIQRTFFIPIPKDPTEQTKIGNYFQQLDTLIAQHQQKHDKLLNLKKALLEKMFPKQGANVPEIRFKGFSGEWEEKRLHQLGEVVTGSTPSTQNPTYYSNDGIPWVTPTDISKNITFHTAKHLSEYGQKIARVVPRDTILVTSIASIGKNTLLGTLGSFNQQINGLVPNEKENYPYFLFTESALWSEEMKRSAASGTMQIVNKTEFSELKVIVPELKEQTKIGNFFKQIDTLLNQHQIQLKKLNNIKQACLEKMFV